MENPSIQYLHSGSCSCFSLDHSLDGVIEDILWFLLQFQLHFGAPSINTAQSLPPNYVRFFQGLSNWEVILLLLKPFHALKWMSCISSKIVFSWWTLNSEQAPILSTTLFYINLPYYILLALHSNIRYFKGVDWKITTSLRQHQLLVSYFTKLPSECVEMFRCSGKIIARRVIIENGQWGHFAVRGIS